MLSVKCSFFVPYGYGDYDTRGARTIMPVFPMRFFRDASSAFLERCSSRVVHMASHSKPVWRRSI